MGVDVFVIDTGWYHKTGDWVVDDQRFPDLLKRVKERLNQYGMKLGLWFTPIVAAKTSPVFQQHPEYVMTIDGCLLYTSYAEQALGRPGTGAVPIFHQAA